MLSCDEPVLRSGRTMEAFVEQVGRQTISGYQLALIHGQPEALCVAGFRIHEMLSRRNHMYVDDQVTLESERSKGHGAEMVEWLVEHAAQRGCRRLDLDSGVENSGAHRFYFANGLSILSFHFSRQVA